MTRIYLSKWVDFLKPFIVKTIFYYENYFFLNIGTCYSEIQRWCLFFRPNDLMSCNTNNGTENQW